MTFVDSDAEGDPADRRVIRRFTGAVRGSLQGLSPYLFVFETGATRLAANSRDASKAGRFVVGAPAGHRVAFHTGLILPLARCKDAALRRQLEMLSSAFQSDESRASTDPVRMALGESMLANSPWADVLRLDTQFSARGECVFEATPGLVPLLRRHFEYVRELADDPRGDAVPAAFARFPAESYGNLMEWYHGLMPSQSGWRRAIWDRLRFALVFDDNADAAVSFGATQGLETNVALDLERLLGDREVAGADAIGVRLEMGEFGWIYCHLSAHNACTSHRFSEVYPPFDDLLAWCKAVRDDRTPIAFSFQEEGPDTNFEAHRIGPDRVLFLVRQKYGGGIHLACVCSASGLAERFRVELASFFRGRFDPEHWIERDDAEDKTVSVRSRMLEDPWLAGVPLRNAIVH